MVKEIVCDTSAIITLFSSCYLSGNEDEYRHELGQYRLIASNLVYSELKDFAAQDDDLALSAQESLSYNMDFLSVELKDIEQYKKILGVVGRRGITDCDISGLYLSFDRNAPFFIDDFKAQFHFSSFFDDRDIFFGVLLVCSILAEFMSEKEVFSFIFDKLVPNRWANISLRNLLTIKHAVSEYLTHYS